MAHYCTRLLVQCLLLLIARLIFPIVLVLVRLAVERYPFAAVPFLPFLLPTITSLRFHPTTATNIRFFQLLFPAKHPKIAQLLQSNNDCLNPAAVLDIVLMNSTDRLRELRRLVQKVHRVAFAILARKKTIYPADTLVLLNIHRWD